MAMPLNVRPEKGNKYQEEFENESRNMSAMVILQNDGVSRLELWMRNEYNAQPTLHGIIEPGKSMNVPKFIAEHFAQKNKNWKIVASSEPAATAAIEEVVDNRGAVESDAHKQALEAEQAKADQARKEAIEMKNKAEREIAKQEEKEIIAEAKLAEEENV